MFFIGHLSHNCRLYSGNNFKIFNSSWKPRGNLSLGHYKLNNKYMLCFMKSLICENYQIWQLMSCRSLFNNVYNCFAHRAMFWASETPPTLAPPFMNKCFQTTNDKSGSNRSNSQRILEIRLFRLKIQSNTVWQVNIRASFGSQVTVIACSPLSQHTFNHYILIFTFSSVFVSDNTNIYS